MESMASFLLNTLHNSKAMHDIAFYDYQTTIAISAIYINNSCYSLKYY